MNFKIKFIQDNKCDEKLNILIDKYQVGQVYKVDKDILKLYDIKNILYYCDISL